MKYLITLCLILTSTSVLAYEMPLKSVNLDKKKVYLEEFLRQEEGKYAHNQIILRRTIETPSKIQLGFAIMADEDVCVKYQRTNIFRGEEDYYNRNMRNVYYDQSNLLNKVCIEFESQPAGSNKWITLDFDNAKKLEKDNQELIRFSVSQNDNNADVIDINAEVINVTETGEGYTVDTVEEGFFRNPGLSFTYQPQIEVVSY
ncbi:hypothetical protein P9J64_11140 [Deltaproteobacteria bacterium IMCC39524]|nr:hypothetical protein [Deltaproteobacteria bacterium IMCC39524]